MVSVRFRSHCRKVISVPAGELLTARSRAPFTQTSELETELPPTEMSFLKCRSLTGACAEVACDSGKHPNRAITSRKFLHLPVVFHIISTSFVPLTFAPRQVTFLTTLALGGRVSSSSYPVTELLARWSNGDVSARDALVPLVYDELRKIARRCLASQRADHTLQPTA